MLSIPLVLSFVTQLAGEPAQPAQLGVASSTQFFWGDFDGDGRDDLFVARAEGDALLRNRGDGRFDDLTSASGLGAPRGTRLALWRDVDLDGRLDLLLVGANQPAELWRNIEGRAFENVTAAAELEHGGRADLGASWRDYDGDLAPDLDLRTPHGELLFHNLGNLRFERVDLGAPAPTITSESAAVVAGSPSASPGTPPSLPLGGARTTPRTAAAGATPICADGVADASNPSVCLDASATPTLGMLYPLSTNLFVSTGGNVGIGTTTPANKLEVAGGIRSTGQMWPDVSAGAPLKITSTTKVANLNVDLLDGLDSAAFSQLGNSIESNEVTNGTLVNADVNASAAIAGTKINPSFGSQNVTTLGSLGIGTTTPANKLSALGYVTGGYVASVSNTSVDDGAGALYAETNGHGNAVAGIANGNFSSGVYGSAASSSSTGVVGTNSAPSGLAIDGYAGASSGGIGVQGTTLAGDGVGVRGYTWSTTGSPVGVRGETPAEYGVGVHGKATSLDPTGYDFAYGVLGETWSNNGAGVSAYNHNPGFGPAVLAHAESASQAIGVESYAGQHAAGSSSFGVYAEAHGDYSRGVVGIADSFMSGTGYGVLGLNTNTFGAGVQGTNWGGASGWGVYSDGNLGCSGSKFFVQPHPSDASKEIHFACLEGNESGTYFRGTASTLGGLAILDVPEEFRLASNAEGLTVQLTAIGASASLFVERRDLDGIVVRSDRDVEFDYFVQGIRRGFESHRSIVENHAFVPEERGVEYGQWLPPGARELLVQSGILNPDFTPNEATAARLGWKLRDASPKDRPLRSDGTADAGAGAQQK